ncbi:DUF6913 domain-containing protein [Odoribacter lunatus]|uniref:DUF6913 domain-containing protein n=1 Tax=Odoribacter lunatus TaxID=2941335 RepID=UPI002040E20C|nr:hypothetical protein [Odoribacter lunatus]
MKQIIQRIFYRIKGDSQEKQLTDKEREKEYPEFDKISSCLVVWSANDQEGGCLKRLERKLLGVKPEKICVLPKEYQGLQLENVVYVKSEDINAKGRILNERLVDLLNKEFDLLIDLSEGEDALVDYVLKNSMAKCKAGRRRSAFEADLMIEGTVDVLDFIDKLFDVLVKFKKF